MTDTYTPPRVWLDDYRDLEAKYHTAMHRIGQQEATIGKVIAENRELRRKVELRDAEIEQLRIHIEVFQKGDDYV